MIVFHPLAYFFLWEKERTTPKHKQTKPKQNHKPKTNKKTTNQKTHKGINKYKSPNTLFSTKDLECSWLLCGYFHIAEKNIQAITLEVADNAHFRALIELKSCLLHQGDEDRRSWRSSVLLSVDGSITTWKEWSCSKVVPRIQALTLES